MIGAVGMALFRRLTKRVKRLQGAETHPNDPLLILSWIASLMITMFAYEAFEMIAHPATMTPMLRPISYGVAMVFSWLSPSAASRLHDVAWWAHGLLVLGFLNYLPYSKHLHVVASLPNVFLSNTSGPGQKGVMPLMDLEGDLEVFGAKDVTDLSWKSLLDGFACTECGRCTSVCPANTTGKLLSPRKIMINVRERLESYAHAADKATVADKTLLDGRSEEHTSELQSH